MRVSCFDQPGGAARAITPAAFVGGTQRRSRSPAGRYGYSVGGRKTLYFQVTA